MAKGSDLLTTTNFSPPDRFSFRPFPPFSSNSPRNFHLLSVVIVYKSDMGKQMIEDEEKNGPPVFNVEPRDLEDWDNDPVSAPPLFCLSFYLK